MKVDKNEKSIVSFHIQCFHTSPSFVSHSLLIIIPSFLSTARTTMKPHPHPIPSLFAITLALATLIHFPAFRCQSYDSCRPVSCGDNEFEYPFWGFGRPDYCGHPDFQLTCQSSVPVLRLDSVDYRVLDTDTSTHIITIARNDLWDTICLQVLQNTTYNSMLFNDNNFAQETVSLYYGCQENIPVTLTTALTAASRFRCDTNSASQGVGYFYRTNGIIPEIANFLVQCNNSITVPVDGSNANVASQNDLRSALQDGFKLEWFANNEECDNCIRSNGRCGTNSTGPVCYQRIGGSSSSSSPGIATIVGAVFVAAIVVVVVVVAACGTFISLLQQIKKCVIKEHVQVFDTPNRPKAAKDQVEIFISNYGNLAPKIYKYSEVKKMTNSFLEKLGQGGYGSVYKGQLPDGRLVAVKLLSEATGNGEDFMNEVASISRTSHVNIVTLLGFCFEGKKRALLYEYMPNGSLDKFLRGDGFHLDWNTLLQIAKGIARGLEYLHRGCNTRIVHFDIKPHNILLDEEFVPKVSDFGLAKLCKTKESIVSVMGARGTAGYMAPEVFFKSFGGVSHKSDVYSYGMMVLEMTGTNKHNNTSGTSTSEAYFPDWIYKQVEVGGDLGDYGVTTEEEEELARKMMMVGLWCIQSNPSDRPSISRVVEMLEGSFELLQVPPRRFESPPARPFQGIGSIQSSSDEQVTTTKGIVSLPNSHEAS